jgi:hypothetical protein
VNHDGLHILRTEGRASPAARSGACAVHHHSGERDAALSGRADARHGRQRPSRAERRRGLRHAPSPEVRGVAESDAGIAHLDSRGAIRAPDQLESIVETLLSWGYRDADVEALLGGNLMRLARTVLNSPWPGKARK